MDYLGTPTDGCIAPFFALVKAAEPRAGASYRFALTEVDAPCARLAFERIADLLQIQTSIRIARVQVPDPRQPVCEVAHLLWRWEGTHPRPALDPPPGEVAAAIEAIVRKPYTLAAWAEEGRALATRLGVDAIPHLLATMVHPPPGPGDDVDLWPHNWVLRVQHAVAHTIAQIEPGWAGTRRRAALHALIHGPSDWSTQAAVVALAHLARGSPEIEAEAIEWFEAMLRRVPSIGHCCWQGAVLSMGQRLPNLPAETRARWAAAEAELRARS